MHETLAEERPPKAAGGGMSHGFSAVLAATALLAAVVYWLHYCRRDDPGLAGAAVKAASTGLLAAILWTAVALGQGLWTIALGLSLGVVGDWFLARRGEDAFLAGMAAFAAGHLAYAIGLLQRSAQIGLDGINAPEAAALIALLALLISTELWLSPRTGGLRWPVRGYVAMIGAMGAVLLVLPSYEGMGTLRFGGALFILSDLLLALRLFVVKDKARQDVLSLMLWPAYWGGQALIALGAIIYWSPKG
jgi:uncharacterized membrane protein YhhN